MCCTQPIVKNCYLSEIFFTTSNQCIYTCRSCLQNISFVNLKQHPKNKACGYYEHVCKCVDAYLLIHVHQSKFN